MNNVKLLQSATSQVLTCGIHLFGEYKKHKGYYSAPLIEYYKFNIIYDDLYMIYAGEHPSVWIDGKNLYIEGKSKYNYYIDVDGYLIEETI